MSIATLAAFLFPLLMLIAAFSDLFTMRISNMLVLVVIVGFVAMAAYVQMPLEQVASHVGLAFIVLIVGFVFFAMRWIGGGDAKLAAAMSLWIGFAPLLAFLLLSALLGGALTLIVLGLRRIPLNPLINRFAWIARLHDDKSGVPYGVALALAAILVYPGTAIFQRLTL